MLRFSISIEDDRLYQGNVKVRLNILFYNENWLISKIPPIPPGPDRVFLSEALSNFCRARAGPFPKGGTSNSPFIKGGWGDFHACAQPDFDGALDRFYNRMKETVNGYDIGYWLLDAG